MRIFYIFSIAILSMILLSSNKLAAQQQSDTLTFICNELLGRPTENSITVHSLSNKQLEVYYEYGMDSLNLTNQTNTKLCPDSIPFVFVINKLIPNTQYYYRMRYREIGTETFSARNINKFITQRAKGETFRIAIEADPHLDSNSIPASYELTLKNIQSANPDFLLDLGDTFMSEKLQDKSQAEVTKRHLLLRTYFDKICHSVPLFLVLGNHEGEQGWMNDGTPNCLPVRATNTRKLYYPNPEPDEFYSGNTKSEYSVGLRQNYYSFNWGNALFVVLDPYWYTTKNSGWGWTLGPDQYNWFKTALESSQAKFKFVFCHNLVGGTLKDARGGVEDADFYEWGGRDTNNIYKFDEFRKGWGKPIHQLMVDNKVNIFFHGHDHFFGKQEKEGVIYQECPQPSNRNIQNTQAANYGYKNGVFLPGRGYVLLTISDSSVKVDYVKTYLPNEENSTQHNGDIGYTYSLKDSITNEVNYNQNILNRFFLEQNYPNPFNSETSINYSIPSARFVQMNLYDVRGKEISTLVNQFQPSGSYSIKLNTRELSITAGIYFYRLSCGDFNETKSMIIIK